MLKLAIILAVAAVYDVQARNRYFLSTKNNPSLPERLSGTGTLPSNSFFNPEDKTILLIHGHGESWTSRFNTLVRDVLLSLPEPINVIVVDWEFDAQYSYSVSSARVPFVARDLEDFIRGLHRIVDVSSLHLVGFGLGAHVAGITGRWLDSSRSERYIGRLGRITGLDPSGSGWDELSARLSINDAHYVEVIHTDGSGLLANGIGTDIGRVNFYANGGSNQPGCLTHSCSHNRAYELFAASLINPNLVGYPCISSTQMNFNNCKGSPLNIGGTELSKIEVLPISRIYRINTGRIFPY